MFFSCYATPLVTRVVVSSSELCNCFIYRGTSPSLCYISFPPIKYGVLFFLWADSLLQASHSVLSVSNYITFWLFLDTLI